MITLSNTNYGYKQRLKIGGINSWSVIDGNPSLNVVFFIEILNPQDVKVNDKTIIQNRKVVYNINNQNKVNAQFNPVQEGTGEYDYFWDKLQTIPLPTLVTQLAQKLNERGIFN